MEDVISVDSLTSDIEYPIVCGKERDFPDGQEFSLKDLASGKFTHAVFPKNVAPPTTFKGRLILHGYYQTIQNKQYYNMKRLSENYQYFVITSWQQKK
ncbi:hypothetical protein QQ056_17640 [Oscillatoria laete-virens NRMC-F 0139]|nr:hypothetical protein [Oscillatoria laete-virens]MDL5055357.1 hypothetical protein [Oscillatoria laete-virens NRMC-F 0139]